MKQSRRMSLVEALANVAVGFDVAVATQVMVFPLFGLRASLADNLTHCGGLHRGVDRALVRAAETLRGHPGGRRRPLQPAP